MTDLMLFTDGGVVGRNPSKQAGVWSWALVDPKAKAPVLEVNSGYIEPDDFDLPAISNNLMELLAAVRGLESKADGLHPVTLCTDSQVTVKRLKNYTDMEGVPDCLMMRTDDVRREKMFTIKLYAGHPTKAELARGQRKRNRLPVSQYNVLADKLCNEAKERYLADIAERR